MDTPMLYIIAGPNGIGKTTSAFDIIPQNIPIISSDEIAKQIRAAELVKTNTQEYSNREAQLLLQQHLEKKADFAIETNLSDQETWKFLIGAKKLGYRLHLVYLSTDDLDLLNSRIEERSLRGEHFVRPDIVEERYFVSLKLLNHYFVEADTLQLIDNSETLRPVALIKNGQLETVSEDLPAWFTTHLHAITDSTKNVRSVKDLTSIEEVRKQYGGPGLSDEELLLRYYAGPEFVDALKSAPPRKEYLDARKPLVKLIEDLIHKRASRHFYIRRGDFTLRAGREN